MSIPTQPTPAKPEEYLPPVTDHSPHTDHTGSPIWDESNDLL